MKTMAEYKADFASGKLKKFAFLKKMYGVHRYLFEYSRLLGKTDILNIEVNDEGVILTFRTSGVRMKLIPGDTSLAPLTAFNLGGHEKEEIKMSLRIIRKNLGKGSVVLDIGANIGWFALHIGKAFEDIKTYAFEPLPNAYSCFKDNIRINGLKNIELFNMGLSNRTYTTMFFCERERCSVSASMVNITGVRKYNQIKCRVQKLDDFIDRKNIPVDFVKCDVEGAELLVLKGGLKTIRRHKPVLFLEMLRKWSAKYGYHPNDIIRLLGEIGYECYRMRDNRLIRFHKMTESTVDTNFLFLYPGKHKK